MYTNIFIINMNPDYYSDIKLAERFIFESSIYLLNLFENKIDSFTVNKSKQRREREKSLLLQSRNIIDPDRKQDDPIKQLSRDLTKPLWNCVTKMEVVALCLRNQKSDHERVTAMNDQFTRFLQRYKLQHEDQSNFKVLLNFVDKKKVFSQSGEQSLADKYWSIIQELINLMLKIVAKYEQILNRLLQRNQTNEFLSAYITHCKQTLIPFSQGNQLNELSQNLRKELYCFGTTISDQIKSVIQSSQGSTNINYWPNLSFLTEFIHPMLIGIYLTIKDQYYEQKQKDSQRRYSNIQNFEEENETIFEQLQQKNCSKITFLNLDGYESPFNIQISKYLSKYVQYISFPLEPNELIKEQHYYSYYQNYSQLLIKQYLHSELTEEERDLQYKIFRVKEKSQRELMEYYKRLFVFPINSIYLSEKHGYKNIEFYQSKFIKFIMKQMIYIQIKQFNPSVIILSLSNQIFIEPQFYEQLIKQLTIISNMRLILYNNLTKSYVYDCKLPHHLTFHQHYYQKYQSRISMFNQDQINYTIFKRTAVFLKIASGTYTLDRSHEHDNVSQKYDIFRIQKYASNLIKLIGKTHPVLQRFKSRCNEYLRLQKMLSNMYSSQNSSQQILYNRLPIYKRLLVQYTESKLIEDMNGENIYGVGRGYYGSEWKNFILRSGLQKERERQQQNYKYIVKYRKSSSTLDQNLQQFIAIQFQIEEKGIKHLVNISRNSQVCVSDIRQGKKALIFLFNHLLHHSDRKRNYYGVIDEQIQKKYQTKVRLFQIEIYDINQKPFHLNRFEYFTSFNYYEIQNHIILFWPTLYNESSALLSKFAKKAYNPKITNLIFFTAKQKEENKRLMQALPENKDYDNILPRGGCTCYKVANNIYIFGGFYNTLENYLKFQVDITVMQLKQNSFLLQNVPKEFHFNYEPNNQNYSDLPYRVTKISQDLIRPRIQYQVYQPQQQDMQKVKIMLIGGVGQKFMRPYSVLGYMAHQIVFSKNGALQEIRRIRLNNVVPVNLKKPVLTRSQMQLSVACGMQNKQIYTKKALVPPNTPTFTSFTNTFVREQQKMIYKKSLELSLLAQGRDQKLENNITIKQNGTVYTAKVLLRHYSTLKEIDNKLALICQYNVTSVQQCSSIIFNLQLQLSNQVYQKFVNLQSKNIPLLGSNIVSIDIYGLQVYALLRHQEYTSNKYVLAYCDLTYTIQSLIQNRVFTVSLKQVYRFDQRIDHFILKTLPEKKIAVIHSFPLHKSISYNQFILRLTSKGYFIRQKICNQYDSYNLKHLKEDQYKSTPISFYYTNKHTVISWTLKSTRRLHGQEEYYFLAEELNTRQEYKKWKLKLFKKVCFQKMHTTKEQSNEWNTSILDIKVAGQKKYEIFVIENTKIYVGVFEIHFGETKTVNFVQYDKKIEEYEIEKFRHRFNVQYLQKLTKYPSRYAQNLQEMEIQN